MMAAAVTANATAAVAAMATAMAPASQQRQWRRQRWRWGEIQQSTKKGTTETAIAKETATVTDSDDKDVDADANNIASTTATRTTHPGCALRWCSSSSSSSTPPPSSLPWLSLTTGSSPLSMATPGGATEITEEEYLRRRAAAPPTLAAAAAAAAVAIRNGERCDHCSHIPVWKHLQRNPFRRKKRQRNSIFAGSRRVLAWTIGQENLFSLALGTSLRPRTTMRWLPQGQRARSVGGRKRANPTSLLKHLKDPPKERAILKAQLLLPHLGYFLRRSSLL